MIVEGYDATLPLAILAVLGAAAGLWLGLKDGLERIGDYDDGNEAESAEAVEAGSPRA